MEISGLLEIENYSWQIGVIQKSHGEYWQSSVWDFLTLYEFLGYWNSLGPKSFKYKMIEI